jgi:hypothetical protein
MHASQDSSIVLCEKHSAATFFTKIIDEREDKAEQFGCQQRSFTIVTSAPLIVDPIIPQTETETTIEIKHMMSHSSPTMLNVPPPEEST